MEAFIHLVTAKNLWVCSKNAITNQKGAGNEWLPMNNNWVSAKKKGNSQTDHKATLAAWRHFSSFQKNPTVQGYLPPCTRSLPVVCYWTDQQLSLWKLREECRLVEDTRIRLAWATLNSGAVPRPTPQTSDKIISLCSQECKLECKLFLTSMCVISLLSKNRDNWGN